MALVAISGNTYPHRNALKAMGGRWNAAVKVWMVPSEQAVAAKSIVSGKQLEPDWRWIVTKDYYKGDINFTDSYPILYSHEDEAARKMAELENGADPTWFGDDTGETEAFLYTDRIDISQSRWTK